MTPFLLFIQKLAITYKRYIIWLFVAGEAGLVGFWLVAAWSFFTNQPIVFTVWERGGNFGTLTIVCYLATLVPGILKRLKLLTPIQISLMLFRRHLGITMFLLAFVHMSLTTALPTLGMGVPLQLKTHHLFGFAALAVLFPLWLTSNDASVRSLGKKWTTIHNLTYIAMFLIFGHLAVVSLKWSIVTGVIIVLEAISWFVSWQRQQKQKASLASLA